MASLSCKVCGKATPTRRAKYCLQCRPPSKYHNKSVVTDGLRFDSASEAARWGELKLLESQGKIRNLRRQVTVPLIVNDKKIASLRVDFVYEDESGEVCEDRKGYVTPEWKLKARLYEAISGRKILETRWSNC